MTNKVICTYIHAYVRTYKYTYRYMHEYIHTYVHTYVLTYILTHMHTCIDACSHIENKLEYAHNIEANSIYPKIGRAKIEYTDRTPNYQGDIPYSCSC